MQICVSPFEQFKTSDKENGGDFHEFYDKYDNMSQVELTEEIKANKIWDPTDKNKK